MSDQTFLTLDIQDRVALIGLNNPPSNTLKMPLLKELEELLDKLAADDSVKCYIITGEGKMFAAGADIEEISKLTSADQAKEMSGYGQSVFMKLERGPKPVIAAINGICLGGGLELAMSCHIRIAGDRAKLGLPEISLGIIPGFGGTQRLQRIVGMSKATELILTGDYLRANDALAIGLISAAVPNDTVVEEAKKIAAKIVSKGAPALKQALEVIGRGSESSIQDSMAIEAAAFGELCKTEDMKEGITAALEKRRPQFKDK